MRVIDALEAMENFDFLLDDVKKGKVIQISRDGKIVARIEPALKARAAKSKGPGEDKTNNRLV